RRERADKNPTKDFCRKERGLNALGIYTCKTKSNRFRSCGAHPGGPIAQTTQTAGELRKIYKLIFPNLLQFLTEEV
ncbi:MAG: hypothetical protein J6S44_05330, partial [Clostridia bacterium]|nr:hypothetical protein [Clostridia bacterium]